MHNGEYRGTRRVRHRRLIIPLVVVAVMAAVPLPAGGVAGFGDVPEDTFYTEAVQWMVDNAITTGTSPTCFSPANPVTRGQAAAFMWRMEGFPTGSPPHPFTDVTAAWQQDPVSWMAAQGITTGTTATTYSPANPVTRGDLAALLHRLAGSPSAPAPTQFPDVTKPWQITPVGWMLQQGITTGTTPTTFSPDNTVTRGQLATFFYRYKGSPPVVIDPTHPAIPTCETQVPGPATTGTLLIDQNTTLIQNHNGTITITADNVTLDCAGHTITGPGRLAGLPGIELFQRTGVTVKNCVLRDFNDAFRVGESDGNTFTNNTMSHLRQGFTLNQSDNNVLAGNTVTDANDFFGISLGSSHGNTLTNNTVTDSSLGFYIINSDNNILTGNTALGNSGSGFDVKNSDSNVLANNVADGNQQSGYVVWVDSTGNALSQNLASDNLEGFAIHDAHDNTFTDNDASNNKYGFWIPRVAGIGNTFTGNSAHNNDQLGILDDTIGGTGDAGTDNNYSNNTCTGNGAGGSSPPGLC